MESQVTVPEAPEAPETSPEAPAEGKKDLPKSAPPYLYGGAKNTTVAKWAQKNLGLSLPETMEKTAMIRAINARLKNHHHQAEITAQEAPATQATPDPEAEASPPGEDDEKLEDHALPVRPERFTREEDGASNVPGAAPPILKGPSRAIGQPGRRGDATFRDSDPKLPAAVAALKDSPQYSHLAPATDEDGKLDPEVEASLNQLPKAMLSPPNKSFRHPQVCDWLYNPVTDVYWYPTEILMRNENLIPVMGEPPKDSIFGSLPPALKEPPGGGKLQGE